VVSQGAIDPALPEGISVERTGSGLEITKKWFGRSAVALAVVAVLADMFIGFVTLLMLLELVVMGSWLVLWGLLGNLALLVGINYLSVAFWRNRTTIWVDAKGIAIHSGPVPWPGNLEVAAESLDQLHVKVVLSRRTEGVPVGYLLHAVLKDGRDITLPVSLSTKEQARFIEREIENYLGIADKPAEVELAK
jgi:hypothetical protein